jgi:hypothetical protein
VPVIRYDPVAGSVERAHGAGTDDSRLIGSLLRNGPM